MILLKLNRVLYCYCSIIQKNNALNLITCFRVYKVLRGKKLATGLENWLMEISSPLASVANAFFRLRPPLWLEQTWVLN